MAGDVLNLHAIAPRSYANGPGVRFVVWFQGCSLRCPGCFNPDTHDPAPRRLVPVARLLDDIAEAAPPIEGITLSGGEPLEQPEGLLDLLAGVRRRTKLSALLFSGHAKAEILEMPLGREILGLTDVLVAGPYDETQRLARGLRGSANQRIHLLTDRYALADIESTPPAEIVISPDGRVVTSGIEPPAFPKAQNDDKPLA